MVYMTKFILSALILLGSLGAGIFLFLSNANSEEKKSIIPKRVSVTYSVEKSDGIYNQLFGLINGKKIKIIDMGESYPKYLFNKKNNLSFTPEMSISLVKDFDGDSIPDALINFDTGGNCCPYEYRFVSAYPNNTYNISDSFSTWEYEIKTKKLGSILQVNTRYENEDFTYAYKDKKLALEKKNSVAEMATEFEVRLEDVPKDENRYDFYHDLDGDGKDEKLSCGYWTRWYTLSCEVKSSSDDTILMSSTGCDRLGVTRELTNGYKNLVCGNDEQIKFNGTEYTMER
jgi:hypothetical protein